MITLMLVAVLGVLLVVVLSKLARKPANPGSGGASPAPPGTPPVPDLAHPSPADARTGDVISVSGAGDAMSDLDFTADRSTRVEAGSHRWLELGGPYRGRRVTLRVGGSDDLEVGLDSGLRKVSIEELGLAENDLTEMDERQNTADSFEFDGKVWQYHLSREAQARRDDQPQALGFYYWEFREQGAAGLLAVRKPEGEPFSVSLYQGINHGDVTVYRGSRT